MSGVPYRLPAAALLLVACMGVGCSPTLNWRAAGLEQLATLLPCKPDHAERKVQLASTEVLLQVSGCEAGGALYAISHVRVAGDGQVESVRVAWRQATLQTLQANATAVVPAPTDTPQTEKVEGKGADGSPTQAQLRWLTKGQDIYQVAVYGPKLNPEMTELLFSELRLQ